MGKKELIWTKLGKQCRKQPFFDGSIKKKKSGNIITIQEKGKSFEALFTFLVVVLCGLAVYYWFITNFSLHWGFLTLCLGFAVAILLILCCAAIIKRRFILINEMTSEFHIYYGTFLRPRCLYLLISELTLVMDRNEHANGSSATLKARLLLFLDSPDSIDSLTLADTLHDTVRSMYNVFSEVFNNQCIDNTKYKLEKDDNTIEVDTFSLIDSGEPSAGSLALHLKSNDIAIMRPTAGYYALYSLLIGCGLSLLVEFYITSTESRSLWHEISVLTVMCGFLVVGISGILYGIFLRTIKIDKNKNTIVVPYGLIGFWRKPKVINLDCIRAIQMCHNYIGEDRKELFEINLVLDTGVRVNLATEGTYHNAIETGTKIATFLDTEFLDLSGIIREN